MDTAFIAKNNIENIYGNINAYFVKMYNYNLDNFDRYKKIVKKLSKTIFNSIKDNDNYKSILMNDFNDIVLNKSKEFLIKEMNNRPVTQNNIKTENSNYIQDKNISKKQKSKKKNIKKKNKNYNNLLESQLLEQTEQKFNENQSQNSFLDSFDSFNKQIKEANKKIKNNFKEIIEQNNSNFKKKSVDNTILPPDNKLAFEQKIEQNLTESTESLYDDYSNTNVQDILKSVIFKQKDNSKANELESYEKEEYLPNLIPEVGDQAPIQPLIYQNSGQGSERIDKRVITIDTGSTNNALDDTVTNSGTNKWQLFRVDLQDTVKIDKMCDVYLRSFTIIGATINTNCNYFIIDIDEFNIRNFSNNTNMRNKITIANTNTTDSATAVFSVSYGGEDNYVTTVNPIKITNLNITLTNQDNEGADNGNNKTFHTQNANTNRVIFELEFKTRAERDELIYEKSIYDNMN